jgi:hypothetical protein
MQTNSATAPYARRKIDVIFTLANGSFDTASVNSGGNSQLGLAGLRVATQISKIPSPVAGGTANTVIYGLTPSHINQLSYAGLLWDTRPQNTIEIHAGDDQTGMVIVHKGIILAAEPNFSQQPNVSFHVYSVDGYNIQMASVAPLSFKGGTDAATALQQVIKPFGLTLENNGVKVQLSNPYLQGSPWSQVIRLLKAANIYGYLDTTKGVLAVWPKPGARTSTANLEISAATGMIAYPTFSKNQMRVRTRFDPGLAAVSVGTNVTVKANLTPTIPLAAANGKWTPSRIDLSLSSETPGGPWELALTAAAIGSGQGG